MKLVPVPMRMKACLSRRKQIKKAMFVNFIFSGDDNGPIFGLYLKFLNKKRNFHPWTHPFGSHYLLGT